MKPLSLFVRRLGPLGLVTLVLAAPTCAKEPTPPGATRQAAPTQIDPQTCAVVGNKGETTVIQWQPTDPEKPVEVRWEAAGKPQGYVVKIKALTGVGEQSPDPAQQEKILAMFALKYEIDKTGQTVLSGVPTNPPFIGDAKEVRWKYQVQVVDASGATVCGKDPDICISKPGGCGA